MATVKLILTDSLLLLFLNGVAGGGGPLQKLIFYENFDCPGEGRNETFTANVHVYVKFNQEWVSRAKSVKVIGMWRVKVSQDPLLTNIPTEIWAAYPPNGLCVDLRVPGDRNSQDEPILHVIQAERIGPSNMATPQVIFFSERNLTGKSIKMDKDEKKLQGGFFVMNSAVQFANKGWIIYNDTRYRGAKYCFCSRGKDANGTNISLPFVKYNNQTLKIWSWKRDKENVCKCEANAWTQSLLFIIAATIMPFLSSR